ncbi:hypothetical protein BLNAU_15507 [Blattamonas nauphoetae]|uniref:Uncharacterized protein n=1 Tax=Blattamonas nauphoetae TaxID=2049346 RepID=A0ABQ9XH60_9EUKA|nr:hypothetical protein BLNAU_15507 [Blattamonas nauphoetae]
MDPTPFNHLSLHTGCISTCRLLRHLRLQINPNSCNTLAFNYMFHALYSKNTILHFICLSVKVDTHHLLVAGFFPELVFWTPILFHMNRQKESSNAQFNVVFHQSFWKSLDTLIAEQGLTFDGLLTVYGKLSQQTQTNSNVTQISFTETSFSQFDKEIPGSIQLCRQLDHPLSQAQYYLCRNTINSIALSMENRSYLSSPRLLTQFILFVSKKENSRKIGHGVFIPLFRPSNFKLSEQRTPLRSKFSESTIRSLSSSIQHSIHILDEISFSVLSLSEFPTAITRKTQGDPTISFIVSDPFSSSNTLTCFFNNFVFALGITLQQLDIPFVQATFHIFPGVNSKDGFSLTGTINSFPKETSLADDSSITPHLYFTPNSISLHTYSPKKFTIPASKVTKPLVLFTPEAKRTIHLNASSEPIESSTTPTLRVDPDLIALESSRQTTPEPLQFVAPSDRERFEAPTPLSVFRLADPNVTLRSPNSISSVDTSPHSLLSHLHLVASLPRRYIRFPNLFKVQSPSTGHFSLSLHLQRLGNTPPFYPPSVYVPLPPITTETKLSPPSFVVFRSILSEYTQSKSVSPSLSSRRSMSPHSFTPSLHSPGTHPLPSFSHTVSVPNTLIDSGKDSPSDKFEMPKARSVNPPQSTQPISFLALSLGKLILNSNTSSSDLSPSGSFFPAMTPSSFRTHALTTLFTMVLSTISMKSSPPHFINSAAYLLNTCAFLSSFTSVVTPSSSAQTPHSRNPTPSPPNRPPSHSLTPSGAATISHLYRQPLLYLVSLLIHHVARFIYDKFIAVFATADIVESVGLAITQNYPNRVNPYTSPSSSSHDEVEFLSPSPKLSSLLTSSSSSVILPVSETSPKQRHYSFRKQKKESKSAAANVFSNANSSAQTSLKVHSFITQPDFSDGIVAPPSVPLANSDNDILNTKPPLPRNRAKQVELLNTLSHTLYMLKELKLDDAEEMDSQNDSSPNSPLFPTAIAEAIMCQVLLLFTIHLTDALLQPPYCFSISRGIQLHLFVYSLIEWASAHLTQSQSFGNHNSTKTLSTIEPFIAVIQSDDKKSVTPLVHQPYPTASSAFPSLFSTLIELSYILLSNPSTVATVETRAVAVPSFTLKALVLVYSRFIACQFNTTLPDQATVQMLISENLKEEKKQSKQKLREKAMMEMMLTLSEGSQAEEVTEDEDDPELRNLYDKLTVETGLFEEDPQKPPPPKGHTLFSPVTSEPHPAPRAITPTITPTLSPFEEVTTESRKRLREGTYIQHGPTETGGRRTPLPIVSTSTVGSDGPVTGSHLTAILSTLRREHVELTTNRYFDPALPVVPVHTTLKESHNPLFNDSTLKLHMTIVNPFLGSDVNTLTNSVLSSFTFFFLE